MVRQGRSWFPLLWADRRSGESPLRHAVELEKAAQLTSFRSGRPWFWVDLVQVDRQYWLVLLYDEWALLGCRTSGLVISFQNWWMARDGVEFPRVEWCSSRVTSYKTSVLELPAVVICSPFIDEFLT